MKLEKIEMPKTGDYYAFKVKVWAKGVLQLSFVGKLTGTELRIAKNKRCIKTDREAIKKLRNFCIRKARKIYQEGKFNIGDEFREFYSPCW